MELHGEVEVGHFLIRGVMTCYTLRHDEILCDIYLPNFRFNAPINSKLQHPPPGIPRAFDCASCPGRGEFERCVGRVGNFNRIYLLFWSNTPVSFFGFCRVSQIYKIEFRRCYWITLSKGSLKEVWRCLYSISVPEKRVKCLTKDEIYLWGEEVQY